MDKYNRVTFRPPPALMDRVEAFARIDQRSMPNAIAVLLDRALKAFEQQQQQQEGER